MEEELAATEEDREVENLLWSNRAKHDRLQKGTASVSKDMIAMYSCYIRIPESIQNIFIVK